jgi:hypothetical protein
MTAPLPLEPAPFSAPAAPAQRPMLRILPVPRTEPAFDPDPFWDRPHLHAVPDPGTELPLPWAHRGRAEPATRTEPPSGPPGARRAAWRLANGYVDVLHGRRPPIQLTRFATADGSACLHRELAGRPEPGRQVRLQSLHVSEPVPGVAEAAAVLTAADQVWAVAFRLENRDGQWRCAHFETV